MQYWYKLDGKKPVPCSRQEADDLLGEVDGRIVAKTEIDVYGEEVRISTVFLVLDYGLGSEELPVLFETMIFGGIHDLYQTRYCTWSEAEEGHEFAVKMVRKSTLRLVNGIN